VSKHAGCGYALVPVWSSTAIACKYCTDLSLTCVLCGQVLLEDLAFFTNVRCKVDVKPDGDMLVALRGVRIVDMKADMMHDVKSNPKLYGTAETEMHKQGFRARKNVGTRMF
jgi:hypothetical protein